jgi:hypothetical protein
MYGAWKMSSRAGSYCLQRCHSEQRVIGSEIMYLIKAENAWKNAYDAKQDWGYVSFKKLLNRDMYEWEKYSGQMEHRR